MKKNSIKGYAVLGILFIVVSAIGVAVSREKTAPFWIVYAFVVLAFAAQIPIWKMSLGRENTLKSKFLGVSVVYIGIVYLLCQILAFATVLFAPTLAWIAVVVCVTTAGVSAVCVIGATVGRDEIERVETTVQKKVFYLKELQVDVELLAAQETDATVKASLAQIAEKIRFSAPMSSETLAELERNISTKAAELRTATDRIAVITELHSLLDERNKKCKIQK